MLSPNLTSDINLPGNLRQSLRFTRWVWAASTLIPDTGPNANRTYQRDVSDGLSIQNFSNAKAMYKPEVRQLHRRAKQV